MKWIHAADKFVDGLKFHENANVVIPTHFRSQRDRVYKTRPYVQMAISLLRTEDPNKKASIAEVGCGTMSISGPFSKFCDVHGYDCNAKSLEVAKVRYPKICRHVTTLDENTKVEGDILVMCEVLEHLRNPIPVVKSLMPQCKYAVITHPLNEPLTNKPARIGFHCWQYDLDDLMSWFSMTGYDILKYETFDYYTITTGIALGKKK